MGSPKKTPNILVISPCTFNYTNGGGVTFSHLFGGWPKSQLANLHASGEKEDKSVCENFYRLGQEEIKNKKILGLAPKEAQAIPQSFNPVSSWSLRTWLKNRVSGNSGWPKYFTFSPALEHWLDQFQPQIIYTILGPISFLEAILAIQKKYQTKLVVHHMDDWYVDAYTSGLFRYQRRTMLKQFHEILSKADWRLTIGDAMAEEYSKRFSVPYTAYQNAIPIENFRKQIAEHTLQKETRSLLYFGSIYPFAQLESLIDVAKAFENMPATFQLVAPAKQLELFRQTLAKEAPTALSQCLLVPMENDPGQFEKEIAGASALLLPANFNADDARFLRFSMPTKLPGYLASGKPVLVYSPESLAQNKYVKQYGCGIIQEERDLSRLKEKISLVLFSENDRNLVSQRAVKLAQEKHDLVKVRAEFQERLCSL